MRNVSVKETVHTAHESFRALGEGKQGWTEGETQKSQGMCCQNQNETKRTTQLVGGLAGSQLAAPTGMGGRGDLQDTQTQVALSPLGQTL